MSAGAGRFAPSPTGPLHLGSLLAAAASFLDARQRGAQWLLRIDDLDVYRNVAGAEASILRSLEAHGLRWDGPVIRQSERLEHYQRALEILTERGLTYRCTCTRAQLKGQARYPGICRDAAHLTENAAVRVRVTEQPIQFDDLVIGPVREVLADSFGDFIIRRRDGVVAYQLATAVDDGEARIRHVIRGIDLLDNTARQIYLMNLLGLEPPTYGHVPMLVNSAGQKLSKQTFAAPLEDEAATANLIRILPALGLSSPEGAESGAPEELLKWAAGAFSLEAMRGLPSSYHL
jgi:glutamyl-Q tRNA(Asp) synthetase